MRKLLKKDFLHYIRLGAVFLVIFATLICGTIFPYIYMDYERDACIHLIEHGGVYTLPLMTAMISTLLIQTSYAADIKDQVLIVLLSNGFKPSDIWLSKLISSYCIGYVCMIISFFINEIVVYMTWHYVMRYQMLEVVYFFMIFPIIGVPLVALLWLLIWVTKQIGVLIVGFLPTILYIAIVFYSYHIHRTLRVALWSAFLIMVAAIAVVFLILRLINKISLEYIANLHR